MHECYVSFVSAGDVRDFVEIATKQYFPIHVEQGDMCTDAKSIMSLFSMGLNRPLHVVVQDCEANTEDFFSEVTPSLVRK